MKGEITFINMNKYISEKMGIAEPTLFYVEPILHEAYESIIEFIDTNKIHISEDDTFAGIDEKDDYILDFKYLRKYITDLNEYRKFPVSEILLSMNLSHKSTKKMGQYPMMVGGLANHFSDARTKYSSKLLEPVVSKTDHSIKLSISIDFHFTFIFDKRKHREKLYTMLHSTILHELNHCYEFYNRKISGGNAIGTSLTYSSGMASNVGKRPKVIWDYWVDNFLELIYMSEKHEVNATVQEAKSFVEKLSLNSFKKTRLWSTVNKLQKFDSKEFINNFNKVIERYNPEYKDVIITSLINEFIDEYEYLSYEWDEKPIYSIETLRKLNNEEFISLFQKKINKAGDTLHHKILKLYSYKADNEEDYY